MKRRISNTSDTRSDGPSSTWVDQFGIFDYIHDDLFVNDLLMIGDNVCLSKIHRDIFLRLVLF